METVVRWLIPPACREEVLGDLHERYECPRQYLIEAVRTVPLVILSRIRRTTDRGLLLLEALALFLALVTAARLLAGASFLTDHQGYLKLAVLVVMALLALVLVDAYAPQDWRMILGPIAGLCAMLAQFGNPELALPSFRMILLGSLAGMLLVGALRLIFGPDDHRTTGA
jgi:hypothetical protein